MDVISISSAPTIASHYTKCTEAFSQLCASLRSSDVQFSDQIEAGEVQDEFGRLRVWAGNMCAYKTGEPSLDNRLRDAVHVRQQVVSLLEDLYSNLREAYMILSDQRLPYEEQHSDSDSSESSSSNDTLDSRTELEQIFSDVREIIDSLYDLSVTIRALAPRGQIRVRASINLPEIEAQEIKHVEGEFPHLRQANVSLLERLGRSNADRRQTLRDLEARHGGSAGQFEERTDVLVDHWRRTFNSGDAGALQTSESGNSSHYSSEPSFNTQSSVTILHQGVAEALSDDSRSITSSAASDDREVEGKLHIPQPPADALSGESFKCIYCYKSIRGSGTLSWRSHLYRHLRPYICTSNECKTPFKTYATRHEWFEHEAQIHRRQWVCQACLLTFGDEVAFVKHQRAHHADTFADWQLPALNDLFSRPADRDVLDTCPLCSKPGQLIRRHLAYHMRELALHVLPSGGMRDESDIEHNSARTTSILPPLVDKPGDTKLPYSEQTPASPRDGPSEVSYTRAFRSTHPEVQGTPDFHIPGAYPEYQLSAQEYLLSRTFSSERDVFIAVMGAQYSGKSTFIRTCVDGSKGAQTFHSSTDQVSISVFEHGQQVVHLIETPAFGFDDEDPLNIDFLKDIAFWLGKSYDAQILLNGIIYLHPITFSMSNSIKANFRLFKALCGQASLPSALLVTTIWDSARSTDDGSRGHIQRADFMWKMIAGSPTWRYLGHRDSAIEILSYLCKKKEKTVLAIQRQLTESGDLSQTDAGRALLRETSERITAYEKSLNGLEAQMQKALEGNDQRQCAHLAAVRDGYFSKVNAAIAARDGLTISLHDLYYQKGAGDAIAEILGKRETSQQVVESRKQDTHEAQQYEERVEREEMSDHGSQAAEREATQATGKGKGVLLNEAGLMSEGLEQHSWDLQPKSLQKREHSQALRREALEQARLAQLQQQVRIQQEQARLARLQPRERILLERARRAQSQEQDWEPKTKQLEEAFRTRLQQQQERIQLERARLAQLQQQERILLEEARLAQVELGFNIKERLEAARVEHRALYETGPVEVGAAAAAVGTVAACVAM